MIQLQSGSEISIAKPVYRRETIIRSRYEWQSNDRLHNSMNINPTTVYQTQQPLWWSQKFRPWAPTTTKRKKQKTRQYLSSYQAPLVLCWFFRGWNSIQFFFERLEWRIIRIPSNQSWLHGFPVIFSEFFYQASHLYAVHAAIVRSPETPGRQEIKRLETDLRFAAIFRSEGQIHGFLRWKLSNRIDTL